VAAPLAPVWPAGTGLTATASSPTTTHLLWTAATDPTLVATLPATATSYDATIPQTYRVCQSQADCRTNTVYGSLGVGAAMCTGSFRKAFLY
jgi:hypothetical protein